MKLGLIIPTYGPASGGVGSVVRSIATNLSRKVNINVTVLDLYGKDCYEDANVNLKRFHSFLGGFSPEMRRYLSGKSGFDIIHQHGIWHPISFASKSAHSESSVICSPHGMLEPWIVKRGKIKKTIARAIYENKLIERLNCFHALTRPEIRDIASFTGKRQTPIFFIPNGVTVNQYDPTVLRTDKILYFGRFHKKKGIKFLLNAWKKLGNRRGSYRLHLVGWGDQSELQGAEDIPGVDITGPVFNTNERDLLLSTAKFLILPSFSEGLPMAILESWAQGTPVLMTPECNLPEGFSSGAAIKIRTSEDEILNGLLHAINLPEDNYQAMCHSAIKLADNYYSMSKMLTSLIRMYEWAMGSKSSVDDIRCR